MDWVLQNAERPAILSMSLGGPRRNKGYQQAVAAGITVIVAAGNDNYDACYFAPGFIPSAITVGSTNRSDERSVFSNFGSCVDIWAPGHNILSAWWGSDSEYNVISGTSMACPAVSGVAALYLQGDKSLTPQAIRDKLFSTSTKGVIKDVNGAGNAGESPNKLL